MKEMAQGGSPTLKLRRTKPELTGKKEDLSFAVKVFRIMLLHSI
jgi:hypothetical protein